MNLPAISAYQTSPTKPKSVTIRGVTLKGESLDGTYPFMRDDGEKIVVMHPKHGAIRVPRANTSYVEFKRKRATAAEMAARRAEPAYQASLTKPKRHRATRADMRARRAALYAIVAEQQPMTVRQVYYQATVRGVIEKTEDGYSKVQIELANMRRDGDLPYDWIVDNTRMQRKPRSFDSVAEAAADAARLYRKALWRHADAYVEIWLEKDALSGVIWEVTNTYDVPLMVARGYASLSFLYGAAEHIVTCSPACYQSDGEASALLFDG